jgi:hypothetical protein
MSTIAQAIRNLEEQREKIDSALTILRGIEESSGTSQVTASSGRAAGRRNVGSRNISEEGRRRIAEAQRQRWARVRAEQGRQRRGRAA